MINFFIYASLIGLCLAGISGLFLFQEYVKKISSLSVSYSSFLVLITFLALRNSHLNEVLVIMVSILAIFSVNLLIGIGIAKNIAEAQGQSSKPHQASDEL